MTWWIMLAAIFSPSLPFVIYQLGYMQGWDACAKYDDKLNDEFDARQYANFKNSVDAYVRTFK